MVEKMRHKNMLNKAECRVYDCTRRTTPEGSYCSIHWSLIPGAIKEQIVAALTLGDMAVHAEEKMP